MGVSIAASAMNNSNQVCWVSQGRSDKTRSRAEKHNLNEVNTLSELCQSSQIIFSICPPDAAEDVAKEVIRQRFKGFYLDANAISPHRAIRIAQTMESNGIHFIDGGIIGGPVWKPNETFLYLSGRDAQVIADCFSNGPLETRIIGDEVGKASSLKMCYAAYSKGITALLAAILATAESLEVRDELYQQWELDNAGLVKQAEGRTTRVTAKAWRFEGEMHEIASTFLEAGLPDGFHRAAAEIYRRMAGFKDSDQPPALGEVLATLLEKQ
jgi:3-hydroxyisobutyrate dehydrogenase-like beta-hydroxyacid dehydrogenase